MRFKADPRELSLQAEEIHREIRRFDKAPFTRTQVMKNPLELDRLFKEWSGIIDYSEGGTKGAPKFPMPANLDFLLHLGVLTNKPDALHAVELTLDKMSAGGIFDHVGGGFSRYSVDDQWHVPHFEKMFYDNTQLVSIYSRAFRYFRKPRYEEVVRTTLSFIERELTSPGGLFFSSMDADSEGVEGEFYTWTAAEVDRLLEDKAGLLKEYFCIAEEGNWEEGKNVLRITGKELGFKFAMSNEQLKARINESINVLFEERCKRITPALDNKIITGWNALMISGYVDAYKAFGDQSFLQTAEKAALNYKKMFDEHRQLYRLYQASSIQYPASSIPGQTAFLDDYAALIRAFLDLYQVTLDNDWLDTTEKLIGHVVSHYSDPDSGFFFFTSDTDPALIDRKMELSDNVIPSSNSMVALSLFIFGQITGKSRWSAMAVSMLEKILPSIFANPSFHGHWSVLFSQMLIPPYEVAIVGKDCRAMIKELTDPYLPQLLFYGGTDESGNEMLKGKEVPGRTMIYICREQTCSQPFDNAENALRYINQELEHG